MEPEQTPAARVLIVAPTGSDAANISDVLRAAGFNASVCAGIAAAAEECENDCGVIVVAEEALQPTERDVFTAMLQRQPTWSDVPIVLITSGGTAARTGDPRQRLRLHGNITLLERPLHRSILLATVEVALRSRIRQFEIRDLLAEREKLLDSLELRVAERTAKLQAMVSEMEAFSYSVSHDLRSPLRVMAGYASTLREDHADKLDEQGKLYLEKITRAAERMDRLTQDLLAYTRIAGSELTLDPVDLDEVVLSVIETYPTLREARQFIHVEQPLGLVCGHAPSLVQCFSNLLDNALKFSPRDKPPRIEVIGERYHDVVRCSIQDHGPGIPLADQERVFGLFERASEKRVPGTGIGLAIVKKAVERMKGRVGIQSTPGAGTTLWFELRAVRP